MAKVYTLSGYPEEVISHAFAKTSRSSGTFQDMISTLTQQKSDNFHSKWVLDYGHNSIAEHVVLHLAIEDVSRLAVEALESGRLASYTEQSTRYQTKNTENVYLSENWDADFVKDYKQIMTRLFDVYDAINESAKICGQELGFTGYDFSRFVLPMSTKVNLGMTINARALRRTLCKMLASNVDEIKLLAQQIQETAKVISPTLLRHVKPCVVTEYLRELGSALNLVEQCPSRQSFPPISIVCKKFDVDVEDITNDLAYEYSDLPWGQKKWIKNPLECFLNQLGEHDTVPRALENGLISFEIVSDYGSFYDMKRHRMASLLSQKNSLGDCGYIIPGYEILEKTGILGRYVDAMEAAYACKKKWLHLPESNYLLPNAFRIRYKIDMNPRELIEVIKMRGLNAHGHTSYRFIGLKMLEIATNNCPSLFKWLEKWLPDGVTLQKMLDGYRLGSSD